jgi:hypothetical protein
MSNFPPITKPIFKAAVAGVAVAVKATPCQLHGWQIVNQTGAEAFVQVFDALQASVTVGTTVPDYVIPLPASGGAVVPLGKVGLRHDVGLTIACTTSPSNNVGAACDVLMFVR